MRKKLVFGLIMAALMTTPTMTSMAAGWVQVNNSWQYQNDDGSLYTGWLLKDGKWYFLDRSTGYLKTGWVYDNGKWYYCYGDGSMFTGGWLDLNGTLYYINSDGSMANGVFQVGYYRYRTNSDGSVIRNKTVGGFKYDEQGCMMVKDANHNWIYLAPNEDIEFQSREALRAGYIDHTYTNQQAFEQAVRDTFGGIWSENDIKDFIQEMADEFEDTYDCTYNAYRG